MQVTGCGELFEVAGGGAIYAGHAGAVVGLEKGAVS
jgi:hypothetical protein